MVCVLICGEQYGDLVNNKTSQQHQHTRRSTDKYFFNLIKGLEFKYLRMRLY